MFRFDVINTVLLVVGMLNFAYGIIIFLRSKGNRTNQSFFLVVLAVGIWVLL